MNGFRPYYAFARVDANFKVHLEKCFVDSPETWSVEATNAMKNNRIWIG